MATGIELATAYVSIQASTKGLGKSISKEFDQAERAADKAGRKSGENFEKGVKGKLKGLGAAAAGAMAAVGAVDFFGSAISDASALEQSIGGVQAVFKGYSKTVLKESKAAAKNLGLTQNEYNELITVSGAMLKNKGLKDFGQKSQDLVKTGADLAAQFGGSTADAVGALNAAMRGESDPIERYGISLNETAVNAVLAAKGQSKLTGAALDQAKAQARLEIIAKQSADAQGAFARESDTLAGKQARLGATWENIKTSIGEKLMPAVSGFFSFLETKLIPGFSTLSDTVSPIFEKIGGAVQGFWDLFVNGDFTGTLGKALGIEEDDEIVGTFFSIRDAFVSAFGTVKEFIVTEVVPRFQEIWGAVQEMWATVQPIIAEFVAGMIQRFEELKPKLQAIWDGVKGIITGALDLIKAIIERVTAIIKGIWERWGTQIMDFIKLIWDKILNIVKPAIDTVRSIINTVTSLIKGDWGAAWESFKGIFSNAWATLRGVIDLALTALKGALAVVWEGIKTAASAAWGGIVDAISSVWNGLLDAVRGPIDRVMQFIQENLIDKINGLFEFLRIDFKISPIWTSGVKRSSTAKGTRAAGAQAFSSGGYTGNKPVNAVAGVVHGREWVINAASTARIEREHPGLLARLNGYKSGGYVTPVNKAPSFPWGRYPSGGVHRAYDYSVPQGTPVVNPLSGSVIAAGWDSTGFGQHVRIAHDNKTYSILGHLSAILVKVGQKLGTGALVGRSGNTGRSTGPHLHWETRTSPYSPGSAFNPGTGAPSGASSGGIFGAIGDFVRNTLADMVTGGIDGFVNLASAGLSKMGLWGQLLAGLVKQLGTGAANRAIELFGLDSGGQRPGAEIRPTLYDQGGMLPPGLTLVSNKTGRPETVLPPGAGTGPSELVVIDSDGALIGRMQVAARQEIAGVMRRVAYA